MSLSLQNLKRADAAWLSTLPNDVLLELCELEDDLPPIQVPVYADRQESEQIAANCRTSFLAWCTEALRHEGGESGLKPAAHHRLLIRYLEMVATGQIKKLMIFMPPGSAKSKYTSELLPAWFMARFPGEPVIGASHTSTLAKRFSGRVQRYVRAFSEILGYGLATEAKDRWENTHAGEYLAAGVGGAIPGYRASLAIVDDPYPGRKEADSETYRKTVVEWWDGDLGPRLKPDAGVILMHTRYHEDDLAGHLLALEPGEWTVLKLPAVADAEDDPLGRAIGEPIWNDDPAYPFGAMMLKERDALLRRGATREWQSQYQQNPRPAEGALFKIAKIEVMAEAPNLRGAVIARGWDLAATKKIGTNDPDWTVGVKVARLQSGLYVVLDVFRDRGGPDQVDSWIKNTSDQDGASVKVSLPEDPGQAGKSQILAFTRLLTGHKIESSRETGDKATRAAPAISQVNGGNFAIVAAPWNRTFLDELGAFPSGAKDDQVDALSRAFSIVGLGSRPLVMTPDFLAALGQR